MAKVKKKEVLENTKTTINDILDNLEKLPDFEGAKIYVCELETAKKILQLDNELMPLRSESTRGKAYNINKIVNVINPYNPAYDFSMVRVEKYPYITNKEKCLRKLPEEAEVSANFHRKRVTEQIENNDYSEDFKKKLADEIERIIERERENIDDVINNPDNYIIKISGYHERIIYGQINYGFFQEEAETKVLKKKRANKHLSIKIPNVIVFQPNEEADKHRVDMEAKYLKKSGFIQIARRVFVKRKSGDNKNDK